MPITKFKKCFTKIYDRNITTFFMSVSFPFKSALRVRCPKFYYRVQHYAGNLASAIHWCRGLKFPLYFNASDRISLLSTSIESDIQKLVSVLLKVGDTVLDIGANIGLISLIFAKSVGQTGKVFAFEPEPQNARFLKYNVRRFPQVQIAEVALSDRSGTANFYLNAISGTGNSLAEIRDAGEPISVECRTLDDFLKQEPLEKIQLIKVDVEGYELRVLAGMQETLKTHPEVALIIEYCPKNLKNAGENPDTLFEIISQYGFELFIIHEDGGCELISDYTTVSSKLTETGYFNILCIHKWDQRLSDLPRI